MRPGGEVHAQARPSAKRKARADTWIGSSRNRPNACRRSRRESRAHRDVRRSCTVSTDGMRRQPKPSAKSTGWPRDYLCEVVKDRSDARRPRPLGLLRTGATPSACGLCGNVTLLTRAHVPPRSAGNEGLVARVRIATMPGHEARRTKARHGGVYVFGLCTDCNNRASRYDDAYKELAWALQPLWPRQPELAVPPRVALPAVGVRPGAIARSILIGMCGINPNIRRTHPELVRDLLQGSATALPTDLRLRLALNRSDRARICGAIGGLILAGPYATPKINNRAPGVVYDAAVYFPPLAWALTRAIESILDRQGYADVSAWLAIDPEETRHLPDLVADLPYVAYPFHDPQIGPWWSEMFSEEIAEIVETDALPPSVLRPRAPA